MSSSKQLLAANDKVSKSFTLSLPKAELHAHLTGSITPQTLHTIWKNKLSHPDPSTPSLKQLEDPLTAIPHPSPDGNFGIDITTFFPLYDNYIYSLVDDAESVRFATREVLAGFERDGVRYVEVRTTPRGLRGEGGMEEYVDVVNGVVRGWNLERRAEGKEGGLEVRLILSVDRKMSAEVAGEVVELAGRYEFREEDGEGEGMVVGVDLCGNPARGGDVVEKFSGVMARARELGLPITVHMAEIEAGEKEIWGLLGWEPKRLGHVVYLKGREEKDEVKKRGLGLELCLSCNVLAKMTTGGFRAHHFGQWWEEMKKDDAKGWGIALSTDDVGIFASPLSNEYFLAAEHFHLTPTDLIRLSRSAVSVAFAGQERMNKIIDAFEKGYLSHS